MEKKLTALLEKAEKEIKACETAQQLSVVAVKYLGKSGEFTLLLRDLKNADAQQRPKLGATINTSRDTVERSIKEKEKVIKTKLLTERIENEKVDITVPVKPFKLGSRHPITHVYNDITGFLVKLGFEIVDGREIETDYYCFESLNIPKNHPARDQQDTFYVNDEVVLRVHTTSMQARVMEKQKPPIKCCSVGRVYRVDEIDATHMPSFHQLDVFVIDEHVTMSDLKGLLNEIFKHLFGASVKVRMRSNHFPFTEPSVEVDASCVKCAGKGCPTCGGTGYIEMLGAGMMNSVVLEGCGIDSKKYSGFAFGIGIDRIAMLKYGITDIRDLYENDIKLLKQL